MPYATAFVLYTSLSPSRQAANKGALPSWVADSLHLCPNSRIDSAQNLAPVAALRACRPPPFKYAPALHSAPFFPSWPVLASTSSPYLSLIKLRQLALPHLFL